MAHTLTLNLLHCVFSTKHRENLISEPEKLWNYMRGIGRNLGVNLLSVGGTGNHVHMLIAMPSTCTVANVLRDLKANSSRYMRQTGTFAWQDGYAAISVSPTMVEKVSAYIRRQEERHRTLTFEDEYRTMAEKSGLRYEPQYLLG